MKLFLKNQQHTNIEKLKLPITSYQVAPEYIMGNDALDIAIRRARDSALVPCHTVMVAYYGARDKI